MKLVYLDEAGNTGRKVDPAQPLHLLAALLVDDCMVRAVEDAVRGLAETHFGVIASIGEVEFHGYEIRAGKGTFKGMPVDTRIAIMRSLVGIITEHQLSLGYVTIDKVRSRSGRHPHELAFLFTVERVQDILKLEKALGLLIADENADVEQRLIENLDRYKLQSTAWGWRPTKAENIIDSIHFVQSKNNWLIQLVDVAAFVILRGLRAEADLRIRFLELPHPQPSFPEWQRREATQAQALDLELYGQLQESLRFVKSFP